MGTRPHCGEEKTTQRAEKGAVTRSLGLRPSRPTCPLLTSLSHLGLSQSDFTHADQRGRLQTTGGGGKFRSLSSMLQLEGLRYKRKV